MLHYNKMQQGLEVTRKFISENKVTVHSVHSNMLRDAQKSYIRMISTKFFLHFLFFFVYNIPVKIIKVTKAGL